MKLVIDVPEDRYETLKMLSENRAFYLDFYQRLIVNGKPYEERKTGKWMEIFFGNGGNDFKCSVCGNILDFDGVNAGRGDANYCPNCGAKMEGLEDEHKGL